MEESEGAAVGRSRHYAGSGIDVQADDVAGSEVLNFSDDEIRGVGRRFGRGC